MEDLLLNNLQEVFRKVFAQPGLIINRSTTAENVFMWDSLTHLELIAEVEAAFGIEFSFDEVVNFSNVGQLADCIMKKQNKGS